MITNWFKRGKSSRVHLGLELLPGGAAVAVCESNSYISALKSGARQPISGVTSGEARANILDIKIFDQAADDDLSALISDWVTEKGYSGASCTVSLPSDAYQLLLVEAPDVPEADLRQAVRWRIKDLISIPVEKAAIDVFLLASDGSKSGKKMAYVVVSEMASVTSAIEMINTTGLELESIDIGEMSLRNLLYIKEARLEDSRGLAVVRLTEKTGAVSLYRKGNLYLSRKFSINYGAGLLDDIPVDSFLLEVQRSLDYFERQMGQASPTAVYLCGENVSEDKVTTELSRGLSVPVRYLDLANMLDFPELTDPGLPQTCVAALGAALRKEVLAASRANIDAATRGANNAVAAG